MAPSTATSMAHSTAASKVIEISQAPSTVAEKVATSLGGRFEGCNGNEGTVASMGAKITMAPQTAALMVTETRMALSTAASMAPSTAASKVVESRNAPSTVV
jgi:hypothetical protein